MGNNAGNGLQSGASQNIIIGSTAGDAITTGDDNVIIGYSAGDAVDTGSQNVLVGSHAGNQTPSGSVMIGFGAGRNDGDSDRLYIANSSSATLIYGEFDNETISLFGGQPGSTPMGGNGVLFFFNSTSAPSGTTSSGGSLYAESGAGKWRGSGGTVTTFGPAEPHCPTCGSDFAVEYESDKYGYLSMCLKCLADEIGDRPWITRNK
jgi:hypothetical protein